MKRSPHVLYRERLLSSGGDQPAKSQYRKATEIQNSKKRKAAKELQAQSTSTAHPTAKKTAPKVTLEDALQLWMSLKRWHSSGTKHFAVNTESTAKAFKDSSQELASLVKRLCELWKDSADSTAKHTLRNVIHRLDDALKETRSRARWSSSRIAAVVNAARDLAAVLRPYGDGKKHPLSNVSTKDTEEHRVFEPSSKYIRQICYAITQEIRATTETKDKPVKKRKTSHGTGQEKAPILVD